MIVHEIESIRKGTQLDPIRTREIRDSDILELDDLAALFGVDVHIAGPIVPVRRIVRR